jgi:hypothetical protein
MARLSAYREEELVAAARAAACEARVTPAW